MSISNRLNKHFVAATAAVAVAGVANAAVVYSGIVNLTIPANVDGLYMNVETGATGTSGTGTAGWDINPYGTTSLALYAATGTGYMRAAGTTSTGRTNIGNNAVVGASAFFYGSSNAIIGTSVGQWAFNSTGTIGFKFLAADGLTHYGWARIAIGASLASRTLVDYAFESTAGASITTLPAPGAIALLGLAGLVARRRRA